MEKENLVSIFVTVFYSYIIEFVPELRTSDQQKVGVQRPYSHIGDLDASYLDSDVFGGATGADRFYSSICVY